MCAYLNFGALRSFVFAFFSLAWLKSLIEFNNCVRSPLAAGGGGAFEAGRGGGGGGDAGPAAGAEDGGGGDVGGTLDISIVVLGVKGLLGDVCPVDNCNGSTVTERCKFSTIKNGRKI